VAPISRGFIVFGLEKKCRAGARRHQATSIGIAAFGLGEDDSDEV